MDDLFMIYHFQQSTRIYDYIRDPDFDCSVDNGIILWSLAGFDDEQTFRELLTRKEIQRNLIDIIAEDDAQLPDGRLPPEYRAILDEARGGQLRRVKPARRLVTHTK